MPTGLVAWQIRGAGEEALFAPTPPLEALRSVLPIVATDFDDETPKDWRPDSEGSGRCLLWTFLALI